MAEDKLNITLKEILAKLYCMLPDERLKLLESIQEKYCFNCGYPQPKGLYDFCQCNNEE